MYGTMRRDLYCSHKVNYVSATVRDGPSGARSTEQSPKKKMLCLFLPSQSLEYESMNILDPLPKNEIR